MIILPNDILNHIKSYIRYNVMHKLCKESNEIKKANKYIQTPSCHAIHIQIMRWYWRWNIEISNKDLNAKPISTLHPDKKFGTLRESSFIEESLKFHKLWTGPPIPNTKWFDGNKIITNGIYYGSC